MRQIAVINQKGGVGKTTTTANLGAALALSGRRVLLVDLDPQAHLTLHYGAELVEDEPSVYDVLIDGRPVDEVVRPVGENLLLLPALFAQPRAGGRCPPLVFGHFIVIWAGSQANLAE